MLDIVYVSPFKAYANFASCYPQTDARTSTWNYDQHPPTVAAFVLLCPDGPNIVRVACLYNKCANIHQSIRYRRGEKNVLRGLATKLLASLVAALPNNCHLTLEASGGLDRALTPFNWSEQPVAITNIAEAAAYQQNVGLVDFYCTRLGFSFQKWIDCYCAVLSSTRDRFVENYCLLNYT
jgi:hypothetical protein